MRLFVDSCGILSRKVLQPCSLRLHSWLISHCPAEAQLLHAKYSCKKQKNMNRLIILGVILHFTSSTYVHAGVLWMCSSNSWTDESHRSAEALCHLFSTLRQRRKWEGRLDNKDLMVTCKVHCKHSISPTTRRKWSIQENECTRQWRKWLFCLYRCNVHRENYVVSIKNSGICTVSQCCNVLFYTFLSHSTNEGSSRSFR